MELIRAPVSDRTRRGRFQGGPGRLMTVNTGPVKGFLPCFWLRDEACQMKRQGRKRTLVRREERRAWACLFEEHWKVISQTDFAKL